VQSFACSDVQDLKQCVVQVKELRTALDDEQKYHRKLEEVIAIEKEKCESWEINCKKLEEQIVLAKSTIKEEHDARMKLSEEIQQLNEMLEQSRADIFQTPHAEHILVLVGSNFLIINQT
jgi:chromosome segregation ATPase